MIKTGFNYAPMNESFSGELAQAVKHLTPFVKKQMVQGLGDVDIENTNIPIIKLSGPRDPKIKSKEYYFFLVYKAASGNTPYALAVTDEVNQRMVIDVGLTTVVNADGDTITVNSKAGSLNWTKRINYAYAIYAIKASDAASAAAKRAARKDAKAGSDRDPNSKLHRASTREQEMAKQLGMDDLDKSGYVRPSSLDWARKKAMNPNIKLDLDKELNQFSKLFDSIIDAFTKAFLNYKGKATSFDKFRSPENDYYMLMTEASDKAKWIVRLQGEIDASGGIDQFLAKSGSAKDEWIRQHVAQVFRYQNDIQAKLNKLK